MSNRFVTAERCSRIQEYHVTVVDNLSKLIRKLSTTVERSPPPPTWRGDNVTSSVSWTCVPP